MSRPPDSPRAGVSPTGLRGKPPYPTVMAGDPAASDGAGDDPGDGFEIPVHPERRYPYDEGVTYEGSTVFRLTPSPDHKDAALVDLVENDENVNVARPPVGVAADGRAEDV